MLESIPESYYSFENPKHVRCTWVHSGCLARSMLQQRNILSWPVWIVLSRKPCLLYIFFPQWLLVSSKCVLWTRFWVMFKYNIRWYFNRMPIKYMWTFFQPNFVQNFIQNSFHSCAFLLLLEILIISEENWELVQQSVEMTQSKLSYIQLKKILNWEWIGSIFCMF